MKKHTTQNRIEINLVFSMCTQISSSSSSSTATNNHQSHCIVPVDKHLTAVIPQSWLADILGRIAIYEIAQLFSVLFVGLCTCACICVCVSAFVDCCDNEIITATATTAITTALGYQLTIFMIKKSNRRLHLICKEFFSYQLDNRHAGWSNT